MAQSSKFLSPAYVLHHRSFSDSSLLIDFFTLQSGRVTCVAKGVKGGKSNKSAILQPFIPLMMTFSGRGEVKTLNQCEAADKPFQLSGNRLFTAFYVNELLLKSLPKNEAFETVFSHYSTLIAHISDPESHFEETLRLFEKHLLEMLGYGLLLQCDADNGSVIEFSKKYRYIFDKGPVEASELQVNLDQLPLISGETLLAIASGSLENQSQLRESKLLMRYLIKELLGGYIFKSRDFFSLKESK
jgi:DNA repair protein RecO (recombination protein O)